MNITFRAENGMCPRFCYDTTVFYIQDRRASTGDYLYSLWSKEDKEEIIKFETHDEACEYAKKIKGAKCEYWSCNTRLYTSVNYNYIVVGNVVKKRETPTPLSGEFDSYLECLNFSKKYVADHIKRQEPEQVSLFQQSK
jgi:hypothetical protein